MKTCKACKTAMGDSFSRCPICGMRQENVVEATALYPKTRTKKGMHFWRTMMTVLLWTGVLAAGIVNVSVGGAPWAVYVALAVYAAQVVFLSLETAEVSLISRIVSGSASVSLLLWGVEFFTHSGNWATEIVIPLLLFAALATSVSLYFSAFHRFRTQFMPMFMLSLGAMVAGVLGIYGILPMRWPMITLSGFAFASWIAILVIHRKILQIEFKKKLHR